MGLRDFFFLARETGYSGVDLRYSQLGSPPPGEKLAETEKAASESGVSIRLLNAAGLRDAASLEALMALAGAAQRLRCSTLRVSGPVELCREAADLVQPLGIRLCTQIHTGGDYETAALARGVLDRVGRTNYGVLVEPANLMMARAPYDRAAMTVLGRAIFGVNLQSIIIVPRGQGSSLTLRDGDTVHYDRVPLGENRQLLLRPFIEALRDASFDGFINVLEPVPAKGHPAELARHTARALRGVLQELRLEEAH